MNRRLVSGLVVAAVVVGAGAFGWRLQSRHALVAAHLPPVPAAAAQPALLAASLEEAELLARRWRHEGEGLAELSRLYHANGYYPEAIVCYEGLRQLEPRNARWPHLQASISTNFGRLDEALPLRQAAVELAPNYLPARLRLGDLYLKANRTADAVAAYTAVLKQEPGNPYGLLGLARCDLAAGDWAKARTRLEEAVQQHPDFIGALSLLVTVSDHFSDYATAEALRTTIGRREFTDLPDPWVDDLADVCFDAYRLSVAAAVANSAGNRPAALALLDRAIALQPDAGTYHRQAGQMLLNDQNFDAARRHLEKAVELNNTDSDAWLMLVSALRGLNNELGALAVLLNGLGHCPQSPSLHLEYARWLKANGRLDEAVAEFRHACELRPSEASPYVELASAYFSANRTTDALAALNTALERQPEHPMALATLMFHAISTGDEAAALQRWTRVQRQTKTPAEVVSGLRAAFRDRFGRDLP